MHRLEGDGGLPAMKRVRWELRSQAYIQELRRRVVSLSVAVDDTVLEESRPPAFISEIRVAMNRSRSTRVRCLQGHRRQVDAFVQAARESSHLVESIRTRISVLYRCHG